MPRASTNAPAPQTHVLADEGLEVEVIPAWGGKITRLVDRRTGRDWLWRNPYLPMRPPVWGASFVREFDTGGFDECFPAVSPGPYPAEPWSERVIPDHGEWWALEWIPEGSVRSLRLAATMRGFPLEAERRLTLKSGTLHLAYRVTNPTDFPFPFIWSAHPLLALETGMVLDLPEGHALEVFGSEGLGERHSRLTWPYATGRDLSRVEKAGWSAKLVGAAPARGWVGLWHGARMLRIGFDPTEVTDLGLWLNYGGWCPLPGKEPYFNLGLEPCIGWGDDLSYAVDHGLSHGVVPPRGERHWAIWLRFEERGDA